MSEMKNSELRIALKARSVKAMETIVRTATQDIRRLKVPDSECPEDISPDGLRFEWRVPECTLVVFGANGDLTKRKLMPALYRLAHERRLSARFAVVGISLSPMSDDHFRQMMLDAVKRFSEDGSYDEDIWRTFAKRIFYISGDVGDRQLFQKLQRKLVEIDATLRTSGNVAFYFAIPPSKYMAAASNLGGAGLKHPSGWRRLVIEKPFGHSLASARELNNRLCDFFDESEIFRMDHYLGKETVQNVLAFRFGNVMFEPLWNRQYIEHVQITAAESVGMEDRGRYYQETGALKDMIQNHLLQVLASVAMEPGSSLHGQSASNERATLLQSIKPMNPEEIRLNAVPGQYGPSCMQGEEVLGFRQESGVNSDACTDTYAAVTVFVDNSRWTGIPFYLRTGKRMPKRVTEIAIQFAPALLPGLNGNVAEGAANQLILHIQPQEGISLRFSWKRPGRRMALRSASVDFSCRSSFGERMPSAYENLLLDAIIGDGTFYPRQDMVEASWKVVEPISNAWQDMKFDFPNYAAGTWGPAAADDMLARRGHLWRNSEQKVNCTARRGGI